MVVQISEITVVNSYHFKKRRKKLFFRRFQGLLQPLNMCFCEFAGQRLFWLHCIALHCGAKNKGSITLQDKGQSLHNSVGQRKKAIFPHNFMQPSFFAPHSYGAFVLCPTEFQSNATFAMQNHGYILLGAQITRVVFVSHCHFRDLYNHCVTF